MSKRFNKDNSVTYQLVHRSHQDSRYHDPDASASVLVPIHNKNQLRKERLRAQTTEELADVAKQLKKDEGKAANYGITFDDSEYDYLQHLKPIGSGNGVFISRKDDDDKGKNKHKNSKLSALLGDSMFPGEERKYDYQEQQDVPDEIKGFKPDLNLDLREALIALEDDNYLDQDQDIDEVDVFGELLGEGKKQQEISLRDYDQYDDEYDGQYGYEDDYKDDDWDLDNFDDQEYEFEGVEGGNGETNFNWEKDFQKYKQKKGRVVDEFDSDNEFEDDYEEDEEEDENDVVGDLPNVSGKALKSSNTKSSKKNARRKKGATTDTSSYSMSSSALCRTEQMTIIDDKFDVLREQYDNMGEENEEEEYQPFDLATERDDFMDLVDDFLDNYQLEKRGRRVVKKNDEMEKYRAAAIEATNSNSKLKNKKKADVLTEKMGGLSI